MGQEEYINNETCIQFKARHPYPHWTIYKYELSPLAPKPPKRKATKKKRVDSSGSEAEYSDGTDTDTKDGVFSQNREDQYYGAAKPLPNECEAGALVELTGDFSMILISRLYLMR